VSVCLMVGALLTASAAASVAGSSSFREDSDSGLRNALL
jgi:hypothetical protein